MVAKIYRRTLHDITFFVDNEAEAPVPIKERQPITSCVFIESTLAENRDLSLAHPNRNKGRLDIKPTSDDGCIDAEGALFKLHYGHGLAAPSAIIHFIYGYSPKEVERRSGSEGVVYGEKPMDERVEAFLADVLASRAKMRTRSDRGCASRLPTTSKSSERRKSIDK
jgi:hypothetical protein